MIRILAPLLLASFIFVGASASQPAEPNGRTIVGAVRFRGQPVGGAKVWTQWLPSGLSEDMPFSKPVTTDSESRFALSWSTDPKVQPYVLFARDSNGRMGWLDIRHLPDLGLAPGLRIELNEVADTHGRLTDSQGAPLRQTRIRVQHLMLGLEDTARAFDVPPDLADVFSAITDDDGRFVLKGVPAGGKVFAEVIAPSFGSPRIIWPQDVACEARLEKAGSIRFRFEGAADPAKLTGFTWHAYGDPSQAATPVKVIGQFQLHGEGKNSQTLTNLAPGRYRLYTHTDWKIPYLAENPMLVSVPVDALGEVTIKMSSAAEIRGRVVDAKTDKGIPSVSVIVTKPSDQGGRQTFAWTTTDADGRFRAFVTHGDLGVSIAPFMGRLLEGYQPLPDDRKPESAAVAAGETHTFPDIALTPAVPLDGIVVDDADKPLPWITVYAAHTQGLPGKIVTDANGRFRLNDLGPDEETALRARTATGTTAGAIHIRMEEQKGPLRLVVSETNAFRLRGRIVNPEGKPIPDAKVGIEWRYRGVGRSARWGIGGYAGTLHTDADGRFESIALWPGDEYRLQVESEGYGKVESELVKGISGKTHDFGELKLPRTAGRISGMIVDSRNQSIKGARVFNNGDGPAPISTISGDDGRFTLEGLYDGPAYVFVLKEGRRFTAKLTKTGEQSVYITLLAADDPPPANQPEARPADYVAARQKLTRHMLERMWELPDGVLAGFRSSVLDGMARIDLGQANRWMQDKRARGEPDADDASLLMRILRAVEAEKIAAADVDEALALLAPLAGQEAHRRLIDIGRALSASDPAKALRFAQEAVVKARAMQLPDRAWTLAVAGELIAQAGQLDTGRKLILEAADMAQGLGMQGRHGLARGYAAARLAPFDFDRAKMLIPRGEGAETSRWIGAVAVRSATNDLERALALLEEFKADGSSYYSDARRQIAIALAQNGKSAEAAKLAQSSLTDQFYPGAALGAVAPTIAKSDAALARSLIDRAFEHYVQFDKIGLPYQDKRASMSMWTAYYARLANYPDMQGAVWRVLACRPTTQYDSPHRIAELHTEMAMMMALVDPATAKWVLNRALPAGQPVTNEVSKKRMWLFAVAMADPERAIGEIDKRIAAAKEARDGVRGTGLIELISILAPPNDEKGFESLVSYSSIGWPRDYFDK